MDDSSNLKKINNNDRDQVMLKLINDDKLTHANSHLGDISVKSRGYVYQSERKHPRGYTYYSEYNPYNISKDSITLVMAPAWGVIFPPYNLARLTAKLRQHGYSVFVHDTNIDSNVFLKDKTDTDYWEGTKYHEWLYPNFQKNLLPLIKPVLDRTVEKILSNGTDIVGFSIYNTNIMATMYMIEKIKNAKTDISVVVGGPESFDDELIERLTTKFNFKPGLIDFRIKGEGELELLSLLENYRSMPKNKDTQVFGSLSSKLDLNDLPFPDYSDYNLSLYQHPDGASIETSRGCIAKCSFCSETAFWKYRWRTADRVVAEMQHQIEKYNVNRFWFVDSLANGNLKEFKNLVNQIIEKKLNIRWNSYARCDGRMDVSFFKKIADSGCMALSFGVESGSKTVLDSMRKKIDVWEIENNLRDGYEAGLKSHVNWVVGFPTEDPLCFLHSLHVLYNCRKWIHVISPGFTCGDAPFSDMSVQWEKYNLAWVTEPNDNMFLGSWYTTGYKNTILHRFIRLKFMQIWLELAVERGNGTIINTQYSPSLKELYKIEFLADQAPVEYIAQQEFHDFNYFRGITVQEQLSASLANEFIPYAWITYNVFGAFKLSIEFDYDKDMTEFNHTIVRKYWATVNIYVNADGILDLAVNHKFVHDTAGDHRGIIEETGKSEDMSFDATTHRYVGPIAYFNGSKLD